MYVKFEKLVLKNQNFTEILVHFLQRNHAKNTKISLQFP